MTGPAAGWPELAAQVRACIACPELAATRTHVVVGTAPAGARLVLLGEAPGAQEDATGRPFVGRAGQVLDGLLADVGVDRAGVAVLNTLKCRPPGNRRPLPVELARCRGWLDRQLALLAPRVVVALGTTAVGALLGPRRIKDVRGRVHQVGGLPVIGTYHPSGALRHGPRGEPMQALRADLALAARLSAEPR